MHLSMHLNCKNGSKLKSGQDCIISLLPLPQRFPSQISSVYEEPKKTPQHLFNCHFCKFHPKSKIQVRFSKIFKVK